MEIPTGLVEDTVEHTVEVLAKTFINDPFQRYLVFDQFELPDSESLDVSVNRRLFSEFIPEIKEAGASLVTLPGTGIASVWILEDFTGEGPGADEGMPAALVDLETAAAKARKRVLSAPRKILHLPLVANDRTSSSGDGQKASVSDIFRPMLAMASEHGWPVCLEATSARARSIYEHLGFRVAEELRIGVGKVDAEGRRLQDGPGITIWAMVCGS